MPQISEKIKNFGLKRFNTLKAFAEAPGISYPNLYQYIREENPSAPGTPLLIKLRKLGCDMNWLLGEEVESPDKILVKEIDRLKKENADMKEKIDGTDPGECFSTVLR